MTSRIYLSVLKERYAEPLRLYKALPPCIPGVYNYSAFFELELVEQISLGENLPYFDAYDILYEMV